MSGLMQLSDAIRLKINNLLKDKDVSIWHISQKAGVPCSTITTFLNGKTKLPQIDTLLHICEAFNITLTEFFSDRIFNEVDSD